MATAASVVSAVTSPALAGNLQDELVSGGSYSITVGGSVAVNYYETTSGTCVSSPGSPQTFTVSPPLGVTASVSSFVLTGCGTANGKTVTYTASTVGEFVVQPTHPSINSEPAKDTIKVTAAPDSTPPVVVPTLTGTAGANGWYVSDVAVSWSVTDSQSSFTSTGCGSQTLSAESAGTTVTCSATSAGGTTAVSRTIKIDKTGPTASLSPSGTLGTNGWYIADVTVTTSGSDSLSSPVTCSSAQTVSAETTGQSVAGSCTNDAGLTTAATPLTIKLDKTAPTAVAAAVTSGTPGAGGWYTSDVVVTTTGAETISAPVTCTAAVTVAGNTNGTDVGGSCTNAAGLSAPATALTVKIDTSNPSASLSVSSGTLGSGGWYTSDVTVATTGSDGESGIESCTADQVVATDTTELGTDVAGSCTNGAGLLQEAAPLNVRRDASPPTAELTITNTPTAGLNGWYTSALVVTAQGADAHSGVQCFGGGAVDTDTSGLTLTGYCINGAGLRTDADPLTVKVDSTGPSAGLAVTAGDEGLNGWYTSDVTVATTGSDSVSGPVTCTADQLQTDETGGREFNGSCTNGAGLTTPAAPLTVKLDKTGPTSVVSSVTTGTPGANGWWVSDVIVATTGSEDVSGPPSCTGDLALQDETTGAAAAGSCVNAAGLETLAGPLQVKIDKTPPLVTVTPAGTLGANGWFVSDVVVTTTGVDSVASPVSCTAPQTQSADTPEVVVAGSCTNAAGLTAGSSTTFKVDQTAPVIDAHGDVLATATSAAGATVSFTPPGATDSTSGVASHGCDWTSGALFPLGSTAVTCTATDAAGNPASRVFQVQVTYGWHGFFQPIDVLNNDSSVATVSAGTIFNKAKAGSGVPVKFDLSGNMGLNILASGYPRSVKISCPSAATVDAIETFSDTTSGLKYDATTNAPYGQYNYTWKTSTTLANTCQRLEVRLLDGTSHYAFFQFTR